MRTRVAPTMMMAALPAVMALDGVMAAIVTRLFDQSVVALHFNGRRRLSRGRSGGRGCESQSQDGGSSGGSGGGEQLLHDVPLLWRFKNVATGRADTVGRIKTVDRAKGSALERAAKKWKPVVRETRAHRSEIDQLFRI